MLLYLNKGKLKNRSLFYKKIALIFMTNLLSIKYFHLKKSQYLCIPYTGNCFILSYTQEIAVCCKQFLLSIIHCYVHNCNINREIFLTKFLHKSHYIKVLKQHKLMIILE